MTALGKALAMIDAVLTFPHPVSLPDLTDRLREGRGTVHRRLKQLEHEGLLLRDPRGHVTVGPRLSALGLATLRSRNQGEGVRGLLQEIVDDVEESCSIGVLDGLDYVVAELSECPLSLRTHMSVGSRARAHCLAGGKIMLADLDAQLLKRLLRTNKLEARTSKTITSRAELEGELATVRARGFALNNQESLPGVVAVAVPIWDADNRTVAALALHGPTPRLSLKACKRLVPRLQRTAKRIARIWFPGRRGRPRN